MPDMVIFESTTPNTGLPLLIPGQAQKEFFVNQALGVLDALQSRTVAASTSQPPAIAPDGACYRITGPAMQAWAGREDHIAINIGGDWHFMAPQDGMRIYDAGANQSLFFQSEWKGAAAPAPPSSGGVIDLESRAVLGQLISALREMGLLS